MLKKYITNIKHKLLSNTARQIDTDMPSLPPYLGTPILWGLDPFFYDYNSFDSQKLFGHTGFNTGNFVYSWAICRQLNIVNRKRWWGDILDSEQNAILPLANQLNSHENLQDFIRKIKFYPNKIIGIGLGAQSESFDNIPDIQKGTLEWLEAIIEKAPNPNYPNISLRGEFTRKVLEFYGYKNCGIVIGCPSHFINQNPELGKEIAKNIKNKCPRIAVTAGNSHYHNLVVDIERTLVKLLTESNGAYIVQEPLNMIKLGRGESIPTDELTHIRNWILPSHTLEEAQLWFKHYIHCFFSVDAWIDFIRHFDLVIGFRMHGTMIALQAGIPAVCIVTDSRTLELCQLMKIPYILPQNMSPDLTLENIFDLLNFDPDEFDQTRVELAKLYKEFLINNGCYPVIPLLQ